MKILKIFGVVVGIHVFALILIFANPGCSSASKPAPAPSDTVVNNPAPTSTATIVPPTTIESSPVSFAPSAGDPATAPVVRFSPTRPGTAAANTLEAGPVADVTPATAYTISKGDSLWSVAKKNHLTVSELASANNLKPGATVRVGQKLIIPGRALPGNATHAVDNSGAEAMAASSTAVAPASAKAARETVRHVVKPGETLGAIARKYQVKVGEIATANNISDPARIRPGMELVIPGWQSPAARPPRTSEPAAAPAPSPSPVQPAPASAPDAVPTIVIPAPEPAPTDLDSGVNPSATEPPVIKVDENPPGKL